MHRTALPHPCRTLLKGKETPCGTNFRTKKKKFPTAGETEAGAQFLTLPLSSVYMWNLKKKKERNDTNEGQVSFLGLSFLIWEMGMTSVYSTLLGSHQVNKRTRHLSLC